MKIVNMKVELIDSMGNDISIVNAARVSFHKESKWEVEDPYGANEEHLSEKDQKLINYLAKHNHWTPFGHAFLSFRIKAPIFVARQLVKHQVGLVWNEVSRRYVDEEPEFWFPETWRKRAENVKQGSTNEAVTEWTDVVNIESGRHFPTWMFARNTCSQALDVYNFLLKDGVAPEQARMVLPQNTMTEWIWSGSLAAFARVCKLRLDPHAQLETQMVAIQINDLVPDEFHYSWEALRG